MFTPQELMFTVLEHVFMRLELMFSALEYTFIDGKLMFNVRKHNISSCKDTSFFRFHQIKLQ